MKNISLPKILFKDKEDSWNLNHNSKYILTADNINEIKRVVNSLSDFMSDELKFHEVYAHLRLKIPNDLKKNIKYDIIIDICNNPTFESNVLSLSFLKNKNLFHMFKENMWVSFKDDFLSDKFRNEIIEINIEDLIKNEGFTYYGRYKFVNIDSKEESEYIGFCLGSYSESDIKNNSGIFKKCFLLNENGPLKLNLYDLENETFKIMGELPNESVIDITNSSEYEFSTADECIKITDRKISIINVLEPHTSILKCKFKYDDIDYEINQELMLRPLILKKIVSTLPETIFKDSPDTIEYHLNGVTSIDSVVTNIEKNVSLIPVNTEAVKASNGILKLDKTKLNGIDEIKLIALYNNSSNSFFNNIIDVLTIKIDVNDISCLDDKFTVNLTHLDKNIHKEFILKNKTKYFTNCKYDFSIFGIREGKNKKDITNLCKIENVFNVSNVIIEDNSIIVTNNIDTPVLLKITYEDFGKEYIKHKYINFESIKEKNIDVSGSFEVRPNDVKKYNFLLYFEDGVYINNNISNDVDIKIAAGNPNFVKSINKNEILFGSITSPYENICFKAEYNGIIKFFIVTIKNN